MSRRQTNQRPRKASSTVAVAVVSVVLLLCFLMAFGAIFAGLGSRNQGQQAASTPQAESRNAGLTIAYSPEKAVLLKGLAEKFNAKNLRTSDRQAMKIDLVELKPDEMVETALAGQATFQAMTPDSSLWLDQLNSRYAQAQQTEPGSIPPRLAGEGVRYAVTPIVIAAWENSAKSLGWPDKPVGWSALQTRARQDQNFKWNHPSTAHASGLLATLAEFYAGAGVQRGLTAAMATNPKTLEFVNAIEKTVRYYGEGELPVIQRAAQEGQKYLDAFVTPEQLVVALNTGAFGKAARQADCALPGRGHAVGRSSAGPAGDAGTDGQPAPDVPVVSRVPGLA